MKRMFKNFILFIIIVFMITSFTGCKFIKKENKEKHEFTNYIDKYYVNQYFLVSGTKLEITDKKGRKTEIFIDEQMIEEMPDMTTPGEKTIRVNYEGKEYTYTILVEDRPTDEVIEKLNEFLNQYQMSENFKMDAFSESNLKIEYLGKTIDVDEDFATILFSQMFEKDDLVNSTYNALFDSIVKSSFDIDEENIISSNDFKANLDMIKFVSELEQSLQKIDLKQYVMDKVFSENDEYYIDIIVNEISELFEVTTLSGKLEINQFVVKYFSKIRNMEEFDNNLFVKDLFTIVEEYSDNDNMKELSKLANLGEEVSLEHYVSSLVEEYYSNTLKIMTTKNYHMYKTYGVTPVFESEIISINKNIINKKISAEKNRVYLIEETILKLSKFDNRESLKNIFADLFKGLADYNEEIIELCKIQKNRNVVLVTQDEENLSSLIFGEHQVDTSVPNNNDFYPMYDFEIEKNEFLQFYNLEFYKILSELSFAKIVEESKIVEVLVDKMEIPEEDKEKVVELIYSMIKEEKSKEEIYQEVMDMLLVRETSEYIEAISEYLSYNYRIESEEGKAKVKELVKKNFEKITKLEKINIIEMYKEIFKIVGDYSEIEEIREMVETIESMEEESLVHYPSKMLEQYLKNNLKLMEKEQYLVYLDSNGSVVNFIENEYLINERINIEKSLMYDFENMLIRVAEVDNVDDFRMILVDMLEKIHSYSNEIIEITEKQKLNNLLFVMDDENYIISTINVIEENYENVLDYDGKIMDYTNIKNVTFEYADILKNYNVIEIIEEYKLIELLLDNYVKCPTPEQEYAANIIYSIIKGELNDKELYKAIVELVFVEEFADYKDIIISLIDDPEAFVKNYIEILVNNLKQKTVDSIIQLIKEMGLIDNEEINLKLEDLLLKTINDYSNDQFNQNEFIKSLSGIVYEHASDETKIKLAMATIIYNVFNYNEETDYNELFEEIQFPNQVEKVDYNELMKKLVNQNTYDMFEMRNPEIKYILDYNENIIGENLTTVIDVNFDALLVTLKGTIDIDLSLWFEDVSE